MRQLAPFVLLALLLHLLALSMLRPHPVAQPTAPPPLAITLIAPAPPSAPRLHVAAPSAPGTPHRLPAPFAPTSAPSQPGDDMRIDPVELKNAIHDIVRDEARRTEQIEGENARLLRETPLAQLQEALRQPHQEIRLANGMLKIITDSGLSVCYQPAPHFARDQAGLFNIARTCP